jgi:hypothetical protein
MKPTPTAQGQATHAAELGGTVVKAIVDYTKNAEDDDTQESVSETAALSALSLTLLKVARACEVSIEELCANLLKANNAMDALDTLEELAGQGEVMRSDADYEAERLMQELLRKVSK